MPRPLREMMPRNAADSQVKGWVFVENNPEGVLHEEMFPPESYVVYGLEIGESGTLHIQGYVEFPKRMSLNQCKAILPRANWQKRRGTPQQAEDYAAKEGAHANDPTQVEGPFRLGKRPGRQGQRSDLVQLQADLNAGQTLRQISDSHFANFLRYTRGIKEYMRLHAPPRDFKTTVTLVYGKPGLGKSYKAMEYAKEFNLRTFMGTKTKWFDGYDGEELILLDDFCGAHLPYTKLLELMDRYSCSVETKGGMLSIRPKDVIICSNTHPGEWYSDGFDIAALTRRIDYVVYFTGYKEYEFYQTEGTTTWFNDWFIPFYYAHK